MQALQFESEPQRVLLVLPTWVGDVVMATPFVQALFARFPDARILIFAKAPQPGRVKTRLIPVLGEQGAEQLLGQGDMLYMAGGGRITRVHGPFVSDGEVEEQWEGEVAFHRPKTPVVIERAVLERRAIAAPAARP